MNTGKVIPSLRQAADLSNFASDGLKSEVPVPTTPGLGRILGVDYWQSATDLHNIAPDHIRLDMDHDIAGAHQALSAGFHISVPSQHPAFARLEQFAQSLSLTCTDSPPPNPTHIE